MGHDAGCCEASLAGSFVVWFVLLSACGGPDEQDCRALCEWAYEECTTKSTEQCVSSCMDRDSDIVESVKSRCLSQTHASCSDDVCCVGRVYSDPDNDCSSF